ncbi:serine hydrolase domain-containing protein [Luteimonas saliphila]|uniref:serine hydrolase domain-containing protein n=1 Tax=Luteimonas saliphila TaxID=2804919 RepID=UPI00192D8C53|nr:serine hydrolase domain-containing protein [Luteimonas saliphila]
MALLAACAPVRVTDIKQDADHRVPLPPPESAAAIDAVLRDNGIATAGFGVMQDGELVWSHYYGDQSPGKKADANTRFNVASITKLIAAETALRLVATGDLDLDAPLSPYWVDPDVATDPRHHDLTTRMVLTHSTGFPNWRFFRQDRKLTFEHDPGTHYGYSGEGFEWLARAIERKLGEPYAGIVQRTVFDPVGMTSASIAVDKDRLDNIARPIDAEGRAHEPYCRPEGWCRPDGDYSAADDLVVTVSDMARFLDAVHSGAGYDPTLAQERDRVQIERGKDQMIDCATHPDSPCPTAQGYGLGFEVAHFANHSVIGHGGSDWAEVTISYVYQPSGDGLIIFLNAPNRQGTAAMADLMAILDARSPYLPRYRAWQTRAVAVDKRELGD